MKVRVSKRAQGQIERAARWWDEHRDLAPQAFDEEIAKAFLLLGAEPLIGAPFPSREVRGLRRLHLARIRYHLYYRIRERTGLSQAKFASLLGVSVRTLQEWEQGRRVPSGAARTLLMIAAKNPRALLDVA